MEVFGASVRGPGHVLTGLPNQDSWAHAKSGDRQILVVSDGVGSCSQSREGSQAACRAVIDAVRRWSSFPEADTETLFGLIHVSWRLRIAPYAPVDCACTCLFAVVDPDGSGLVAQLGDGLVLFSDTLGLHAPWMRPEQSFSNQTEALGFTKRISGWKTMTLPAGTRQLVLCTDGVSDDLMPDSLEQFVGWLTAEICPLPAQTRWQRLASSMRNWPTPKHQDDKTIAVIELNGVNK